MNKPTIYHWITGALIFAAVVGFWAWQLPSSLGRENGKPADFGLARILSSFGNANGAADGLAAARDRIERGLANLNAGLVPPASASTDVVGDMKAKIEVESALKGALSNQNANVNADANANANVNAAASSSLAPSTAKPVKKKK